MIVINDDINKFILETIEYNNIETFETLKECGLVDFTEIKKRFHDSLIKSLYNSIFMITNLNPAKKTINIYSLNK